jgi:tripartite-type tricarboxylate transporter receptor subunit TctC
METYPMKRRLSLTLAAAAAIAAIAPAHAQDFPNKDKPITFVVPFAAGGPTDKGARDLAAAMTKVLGGQPIVVENVAGASGSIGANKVAKAAADGYTLLFFHIGQATLPTLMRKIPYNVETDFDFLGMVNDNPMSVVARPTMAANNFAELRTWLNDNKGKINLAHAGIGSASHLCGMLFQQALAIDMTSVPYRGTAPAMTDLLGGQVDVMCDQTSNTVQQIEGKKIKGYSVTSANRLSSPALKDLPTMQEAGFKGFQVGIWHGLYGPKGMPAPVVKKLNDALKVALKDPEFVSKTQASGASVISDARTEPAEHKKFVSAEIAKWAPVIKAAGVYAD